MAKRYPEPSEPVRALIWQRARELNITFKELSELAERNQTYVQQFVTRGSPRELPESVRKTLSDALKIPEDDLRYIDQQSRPRRELRGSTKAGVESAASADAHNFRRLAPGSPSKPVGSSLAVQPRFVTEDLNPEADPTKRRGAGMVPVFSEGDEINDSLAVDWVPTPGTYAGTSLLFAVWGARDSGRMRVGDLAFVRSHQPPAIGDAVVVAKENRVSAIGTLVMIDDEEATVQITTDRKSFARDHHRLYRIAVIVLK